MSHPLKNKLAIDVDDQAGIGNIGGVRIEGRKIEVAFFDPRDPRVTVALIDEWRSFGRLAGLRVVPSGWGWVDSMSGSEAAKKASDYISALEKDGKRRIDVMEYDIETHDTPWQKEFLVGKPNTNIKGIRGLGGFLPTDPSRRGYRWGRPGVWTMEGRQSASSSEAALAAASGLLVGPQCYNGPMTEAWDYNYELKTWVLNNNPDHPNGAQIPITQMIPYYDAKKSLRPFGTNETVLFATSRLTELLGG